jgi:four helix bundle protein
MDAARPTLKPAWMDTPRSLRDFVAWQKAVTLQADLIRLSLQPPVARHPWLAEQLRTSGRSLAGNLAMGQAGINGCDRDFHLPVAKAEAADIFSLLVAATQAGLLEAAVSEPLERRCEEVQRIIHAILRPSRPEGPAQDRKFSGGRGPWRQPPPSDAGPPGVDPWDNRS